VLPTGSALEQARRAALLQEIRTRVHAPADFIDEDLDAFLNGAGVSSLKELFANGDSTRPSAVVQLTYEAPVAVAATRRPLPIAAALLIRDAALGIAELVREARAVREQLRPLGIERPPDQSLLLREPVVVAWVVPLSIFDDTDWPGANRNARRAAAGKWLAREGIGLVAVGP
jgi:hypothetical protein